MGDVIVFLYCESCVFAVSFRPPAPRLPASRLCAYNASARTGAVHRVREPRRAPARHAGQGYTRAHDSLVVTRIVSLLIRTSNRPTCNQYSLWLLCCVTHDLCAGY